MLYHNYFYFHVFYFLAVFCLSVQALECIVCSEGIDEGCRNGTQKQEAYDCTDFRSNLDILRRIQHNEAWFTEAGGYDFPTDKFNLEFLNKGKPKLYRECFTADVTVNGKTMYWRGCRDADTRPFKEPLCELTGERGKSVGATGIIERMCTCGEDLCNASSTDKIHMGILIFMVNVVAALTTYYYS